MRERLICYYDLHLAINFEKKIGNRGQTAKNVENAKRDHCFSKTHFEVLYQIG